MEAVHQPVQQRREQQRGGDDEHQARVEREQSREQFAGRRDWADSPAPCHPATWRNSGSRRAGPCARTRNSRPFPWRARRRSARVASAACLNRRRQKAGSRERRFLFRLVHVSPREQCEARAPSGEISRHGLQRRERREPRGFGAQDARPQPVGDEAMGAAQNGVRCRPGRPPARSAARQPSASAACGGGQRLGTVGREQAAHAALGQCRYGMRPARRGRSPRARGCGRIARRRRSRSTASVRACARAASRRPSRRSVRPAPARCG